MGNAPTSFEPTADQVLKNVDLSSKTVIVTGANRGIGKEITRSLAAKGATVILACRNEQKAKKTITRLVQKRNIPEERLIYLPIDLLSFESVLNFVELFKQLNRPLNILINNAGIFPPEEFQRGENGYEKQFTVNYLSHFLLTIKLLPNLLENHGSKVICVSTHIHFDPIASWEFNIANLPPKKKNYHPFKNFGLSKMALIMFASLLNSRFKYRNLVAYSVDPGFVPNRSFRNSGLSKVTVTEIKNSAQAAGSVVYCAAMNVPGEYYSNSRVIQPSNDAKNSHFKIVLWRMSERLLFRVGIAIDCFDEQAIEFSKVKSAITNGAACLIPKTEWAPDASATTCTLCSNLFTSTLRKHHCRFCGQLVCDPCSRLKLFPTGTQLGPYRACTSCVVSRKWHEDW